MKYITNYCFGKTKQKTPFLVKWHEFTYFFVIVAIKWCFFQRMASRSCKPLTDEELLQLLENDSNSDLPDILSDDDDQPWPLSEDLDRQQNMDALLEFMEDRDNENQQNIEEGEKDEAGESDEESERNKEGKRNEMDVTECDNTEVKKQQREEKRKINEEKVKNMKDFYKTHDLTEKQNIRWLNNVEYETRNIEWYRARFLPVVDLPPPVDFFRKYIPDQIYEQMMHMTNLYAIQTDIARFPPTTVDEIRKFIGIHIIMGNMNFPRVEMYWNPSMGLRIISENMTLRRFYKLRQTIHLVDINSREDDNNDRLWKVRSLYESFRKRCLELPLEQNLCVDEQVVPFKGNLNIKQYLKNKPKKWGVKIYVLAGKSGIIYDFIIYQGTTTELNPSYTHCGAAAGIVMQLSERISEPNHGLFFDNYFSTYQLFQFLAAKSIFAVGTVRLDRFAHPKLPSDKEMKQQGRGSSAISVSKDGIVLTKWYDNKGVVVGSNFIGIGEKDYCRRWDKTKKEYIQVPRPESIKLYNNNMGGVDKHDFLLSLYRSYVRSKKWTVRMISHAIDLALVNSWLEYRQQASELGMQQKYILDLLAFRQCVAETLILSKNPPKRGRPSSASMDSPGTSRKPPNEFRPPQEARYDGYKHFPEIDNKKDNSRCKMEGCKLKTHVFCKKCEVHLCLTKDRNCFFSFHSR